MSVYLLILEYLSYNNMAMRAQVISRKTRLKLNTVRAALTKLKKNGYLLNERPYWKVRK